MDINQLKCFISVAQTLNFSEAARKNYVSQSTISRYIIDLEKEFGVKLFERSHRDVVITNEGKLLLPYAIEIVDNINKAKNTIKQMHNGGQGRLIIGCDITSLTFPSRCIADFSEKYPNITIEVRQMDYTDRSNVIENGEYDFCFMPRDMVPESRNIEMLVTHSEQLVMLTKNDTSNKKAPIIHNLGNKKLLLLSENVSPIVYMEIMDLFRTFHITPNIESTFDDLTSMFVSIFAGIGVSVIPKSLSQFSTTEGCEVYPIDDVDTSIAYVVAWKKNIANPVARLFIESVKRYCQEEEDDYGL